MTLGVGNGEMVEFEMRRTREWKVRSKGRGYGGVVGEERANEIF